ncbi:MAG: ABC transporter permease [Myxococcales bacterium]|nr:ABC transporter permease [Myxococcales bacterium]
MTTHAESPGLFAALAKNITEAKDLARLALRAVHYLVRGKREPGSVARQMKAVGNDSLFFMCVTMAFIGAIIAFQSGLQSKKLLPDFSMLGATFLKLLVRDLAVSVGALPLATRVGAGIAAEIGSMVVTEQIDALRMCAADPIDFLIKPRFLASLIMTTMLIVWSGTVAFVAGALTAYLAFDVPLHTFFNIQLVDVGDLSIGLAKCVAYGAAIPIVSGYCGLSTFGGSEGVGWATTRAVVNTSLAIIILNFFISGAGFLIFPG